MVNSQAVLFPAVALVNSAGVGMGLLISQWSPGQAAQSGSGQADITSSAVLNGNIDDCIWISTTHQSAVLSVLTERTRYLVSGWKLTVYPDVSLQVCETWKHLRPTWCKQKRGHRVH